MVKVTRNTVISVIVMVTYFAVAMADQNPDLVDSSPVLSITNTQTVTESDGVAKVRIELDRPAETEVRVFERLKARASTIVDSRARS